MAVQGTYRLISGGSGRHGFKCRQFDATMDKAIHYHFADFTVSNYRNLVRLAKAQYAFRSYRDFQPDERFVLWRHDIDMSVHRAVKLARVELEEGVKATYFLHLHSEFYNLLEREIRGLVGAIVSLGHNIGLHFDAHYYNEIDSDEAFEALLIRETRFVEQLCECSIHAFSFHNPTASTRAFGAQEYAGLFNADAARLRAEIPFCSDSNGYWRYRRLEDVLRKATDPCLQILTHPELWQDHVMSPKQRVYRCIDGRAEKTRTWYDNTLRSYGRENVDW